MNHITNTTANNATNDATSSTTPSVTNAITNTVTTQQDSEHISSVETIVAELAAGRMVVVVDDEDRENEGDLVIASDFITADAINFMARFGRGLICLTLTKERCERLQLPPMATRSWTPPRLRRRGCRCPRGR